LALSGSTARPNNIAGRSVARSTRRSRTRRPGIVPVDRRHPAGSVLCASRGRRRPRRCSRRRSRRLARRAPSRLIGAASRGQCARRQHGPLRAGGQRRPCSRALVMCGPAAALRRKCSGRQRSEDCHWPGGSRARSTRRSRTRSVALFGVVSGYPYGQAFGACGGAWTDGGDVVAVDRMAERT
jgi:hypothetical protein